MPNHITNIIKAPAHVLSALHGKKADNKGNIPLVDFNSIIPMPDKLHETVSNGDTGIAEIALGQIKINLRSPSIAVGGDLIHGLKVSNAIRDMESGRLKSCDDKTFENFVQMLRNIRACGHSTWYTWAIQEWGAKWNAYSIEALDCGLKFETAWNTPLPVIRKLSSMFPDDSIELLYADEDVGSNLGHLIFKNGEATEIEIEDHIDFALTLTGHDREYYQQNASTGRWEYKEQSE